MKTIFKVCMCVVVILNLYEYYMKVVYNVLVVSEWVWILTFYETPLCRTSLWWMLRCIVRRIKHLIKFFSSFTLVETRTLVHPTWVWWSSHRVMPCHAMYWFRMDNVSWPPSYWICTKKLPLIERMQLAISSSDKQTVETLKN